MMTFLIIVPFLFRAHASPEAFPFQRYVAPWRKFLLVLYNTQRCL